MNFLDAFTSQPSQEELALRQRSAAIKAAGLSDRRLLTPEQERLVSLTQQQMVGAPMREEDRKELELLSAKNTVRKGDEQAARDRSVGKHYLNAAHKTTDTDAGFMAIPGAALPLAAGKVIGELVTDETKSPAAGLAAEVASSMPSVTAKLLQKTGQTMAKVPTNVQEARALLLGPRAATAAAEELAAARRLIQEAGMTRPSQMASVEKTSANLLNEAKGLDATGKAREAERLRQIAVSPEINKAPLKAPLVEEALAKAETKASAKTMEAEKAPKVVMPNKAPDRRPEGFKDRGAMKTEADKAELISGRTEKINSDLAKAKEELATEKGKLDSSIQKMKDDAALAERNKAELAEKTKREADIKAALEKPTAKTEAEKAASLRGEEAVTAKTGEAVEKTAAGEAVAGEAPAAKKSLKEFGKNLVEDIPGRGIAKKAASTAKSAAEFAYKKPITAALGTAAAVVGGGKVGDATFKGFNSRGKPGAPTGDGTQPPPGAGEGTDDDLKNGETQPPPEKQALTPETAEEQAVKARGLRPESVDSDLTTVEGKQAAFDKLTKEADALYGKKHTGFQKTLIGIGKFFGGGGTEDFFRYVAAPDDYLQKEGLKARTEAAAGNTKAAESFNAMSTNLRNFQIQAKKLNEEIINSIDDKEFKKQAMAIQRNNPGQLQFAFMLAANATGKKVPPADEVIKYLEQINSAIVSGQTDGAVRGATHGK